MKIEYDESFDSERAAFREFALACRAERDRLASARLAEHDRRFAGAGEERQAANRWAARLIAGLVER
ncbi:MAG: hypothetical protein ABI699_10215 [Caldimonas sp.]